MWRLIYAIPSWLLFELIINIPLLLIGYIMVPLACIFKAYEMTDENLSKPDDGPIYHFTWPIMFVWDNYGDGIANRNYKRYDSMFKQIFYWTCIRNPTNNLRIVPYISCKVNPKKIDFKGSFGSKEELLLLQEIFNQPETTKEIINKYDTKVPQWYFCWQGIYTSFYWQFKFKKGLYRFWAGTKLYPTDIYGVTEYRKRGAGFTLQFKKVLEYE